MGAARNEPAIDSSGDINTFCRNLERLLEERFGDRVTIKKGFEVRRLLLDADRRRIAGVRCAGSDSDSVLEADKYILGRKDGRCSQPAAAVALVRRQARRPLSLKQEVPSANCEEWGREQEQARLTD